MREGGWLSSTHARRSRKMEAANKKAGMAGLLLVRLLLSDFFAEPLGEAKQT